MGLEREKFETSIVMGDEEFNRSIEPILSKNENKDTVDPGRDPHRINAHFKVGFDDVIGEPRGIHSFDKVWIGSHAVFELVKYAFYLLLTTLLAIPMSFVAGSVFAVLGCIHIWVVVPVTRGWLMVLPSVQTIWASWMHAFIAPLSHSAGRFWSAVRVKAVNA